MAEYIRVTVDPNGGQFRIPKGRPGAGQFARGGTEEFRRLLRASNRQMAQELQAVVVENIPGQISRRNVSTGRLAKVTADPQNIEWDNFHYGVGVEKFLDHSMAKYWRTIEEGSEIVWADVGTGRSSIIGMELTGFWGGSLGRVTADRAYGARPWSRHSSRRSDMFVPTGKQFRQQGRFAKYEGTGGKGGAPNFSQTTTVKNEIQPHHDYANAYASFRPGEKSLAEINKIISRAMAGAFRVE